MPKYIKINVTYDNETNPIYKNEDGDVFPYQMLKELKAAGYEIVYQYLENYLGEKIKF